MINVLITSSVLIAALLILRRLFRSVLSRRVQYALWGLVLLRLLVPVNLPAADFSVLTAAKPVEQTVTRQITARPVYVPVARAPLAEHPSAPDLAPERTEIAEGESVWLVQTDETAVQYKRLSARTVLVYVWLAGSGAAGLFLLAVNGRFWRRLCRARKLYPVEGCALPVYLVETGLSSPCLFGLFRPAIYLTPAAAASPDSLRHVLAHETTHARHLDHLWTLLRGVCLVIYWFNPLVWMASAAARTDCELACDEGTLARLEEADRIPYGQTLLSLIPVRRTGSPMLAATTMAAGKKQLKDRFTRIAKKPRQFAAAAVAVALLAGVVSACTFTGAQPPDISLPGSQTPQEDAGLRALTGEELRFFNEDFFNGAGAVDGYGYPVYSILNQFANPMNLYSRPEDIDLYQLFYCEPGQALSDRECEAAFGTTDLLCDAYKLTADEINVLLTRHTGLTLEQTNKVGLGSVTHLPEYGAYYWMHGDTNYPGDLTFLMGTREGNTVKLYQNSGFVPDWYCVTLEEQTGGGYWFRSNLACERPSIPTPFPTVQPDTVISLRDLAPYEAPAVTVLPHTGDFVDTYENRLENWSIYGHGVVVYRATDGEIYAAIQDGETMNVFLSEGLSEESKVLLYSDLLGHDGFAVSYFGQTGPHSYGTLWDYFYFDGGDTPVLLARVSTWGDQPLTLDLDGDGRDELVSERELFFQRDGRLFRASLDQLILEHCPTIDFWDYGVWDRYAKCLFISGLGTEPRTIFRYLYFTGEDLRLYRDEKPHHDHMVDGVDQNVPDEVVKAARDYVENEILDPQPDGTWLHKGREGYLDIQETYDDWRIERISRTCVQTVGDVVIEWWTFNYELHVVDPEKVVLAGGKYFTEDNWVSPGYPNCDGLFFRVEGEKRTFLWHDMINDMSPDSVAFREYLIWNVERAGTGENG